MKYLLLLGLLALPVFAQTNSGILFVNVAPSGSTSCRSQPRMLVSGAGAGTLYTPQGTSPSCAWAIVGGGGGGSCAGLLGDVTGPCGATVVGKTNGLTLPLSSAFLSTNASRQVINGTPWQVFSITSNTAASANFFTNRSVFVVPSGTFNLTLEATASQPAFGQYVSLINYGNGSVTIVRNGQNINGGTSAIVVPAASDAQHPNFAYAISDGTDYFVYVTTNYNAPVNQVFSFGAGFTNSGSAISTAIGLPVTAPSTCTIKAWSISIPAADTGTATVKFLKIAAGTSSPAIGNSINTSGVSLASGTHIRSTTLSDFTTLTVTAGDIIAADLITVGGTPTGLTANFECQ